VDGGGAFAYPAVVARSSSAGEKRARQPKVLEPIDGLVAAVEQNVRQAGALARTAISAEHRVPLRRRAELFVALAARGLEVNAKHVRVPLASQLAARLEGGAALAVRGIEHAVAGATRKDVVGAANALVHARRARWVVRSREVTLVEAAAAVVDERALDRLEGAATGLLASIRLARARGAGLLRVDVEEALRGAVPRAEPAMSSAGSQRADPNENAGPAGSQRADPNENAGPAGSQRADPNENAGPAGSQRADPNENAAVASDPNTAVAMDVGTVIEAHREVSGLTFVPNVVRAMGGTTACAAVHAELLRGARAGVFELRPESGMGRLSAEDAAFCVPGPQSSKLSWVRRIQGAG
jgi:hypothetical protein